ncbi:MAG TPA: hypothetical protein VEB65_12655 [Solirubrobacterales bacterium]|nr:hypothetical protein [Solirubrobacterales bacterium]
MPLEDDPKLLENPTKFARRVNQAIDLDVDAMRKKIPGLLQFAKTFIGTVLEQEFGIKPGGYPISTRLRAAAQTARLKKDGTGAARSLLMAVVDVCDFEIEEEETYGSEDRDEDEAWDEILELIDRLLVRFSGWLDPERFEQLSEAAADSTQEFSGACDKLRIT